jgi:hypothetical protein
LPTLARCPLGCSMLKYVPRRCRNHELAYERRYITEGELDYLRKVLRDWDKEHGNTDESRERLWDFFGEEVYKIMKNTNRG